MLETNLRTTGLLSITATTTSTQDSSLIKEKDTLDINQFQAEEDSKSDLLCLEVRLLDGTSILVDTNIDSEFNTTCQLMRDNGGSSIEEL